MKGKVATATFLYAHISSQIPFTPNATHFPPDLMQCNMDVNRHGAQLIFMSHDLSTMNNEVFRRDEVWFGAKGTKQNSKLYSLVEFKTKSGDAVRKDAKYDKQYLEGKYGADPYLRKSIDWSVVNA